LLLPAESNVGIGITPYGSSIEGRKISEKEPRRLAILTKRLSRRTGFNPEILWYGVWGRRDAVYEELRSGIEDITVRVI